MSKGKTSSAELLIFITKYRKQDTKAKKPLQKKHLIKKFMIAVATGKNFLRYIRKAGKNIS